MPIHERPIPTHIYETVSEFAPVPGSAYIFGTSVEDRSAHSSQWESAVKDVLFARILRETSSEFSVDIKGTETKVELRSESQLQNFWASLGRSAVYLDITGLGHHVWAPLLKVGLEPTRDVTVVYVEPVDYRFSASPTEGEIFDLSEKITGIAPIPGFASLVDGKEEGFCFVPLLGFEGTRLAYLVEQVEPGDKIVPVIGVPGFRPEYPFHTYHGNRSVLTQTRAWYNVRYATANCPFSLFYLLGDIATQNPEDILKIAPIGTKPHALGAVLFAITAKRQVELVYDHPVRKAKRTDGSARLLAYHVSQFFRRGACK